MTKRFIRRTALLLVAVALVLAGCARPSPTPAASPARAAEPLPVFGGALKYDPNLPVNGGRDITLKFWVQTENEAFYRKWTQEYSMLHPNVSWDIATSACSDLFKKLPIALQSGTGPDLFHVHNMFTRVLVPNMEPYPEDVFPLAQMEEDFIGVGNHIIDGKLYFMDYGIMTGGMLYNKKLWAAAGLTDADIPKTWDQFISVATRMTRFNASGKMTVAGFNMNNVAHYLMNAVAFEDGQFIFDKDGKTAMLDTPAYVKACGFVRDLYAVHKIGSTIFPANIDSFGNGKAGIIYTWGWAGAYLKRNFPDVQYGFFPTPTFDGGTPPVYDRNNGEETAGVNAGAAAEAKVVAFDFIKYLLCNDDALVDNNVQSNLAPSKRSVQNRPEITEDPILSGQLKILDRTFWPGAVPDLYWSGICQYMGDPIMLGNEPPETVLPRAEKLINKDLADTGFVSIERQYAHAEEFKN